MPGSILYLHGFLSSPQSAKACATLAYLQQHHPDIKFIAPQLSGIPSEAWQQAQRAMHSVKEDVVGIMGSSMGGFLATLLAERHQCKASIINPAVAPHELFPEYLGTHTNPYTQETFELTANHIQHVAQLVIDKVTSPDNYQVFLQTEDEVLDYRLAEQLYQDTNLHIVEGGDHGYQDFDNELPKIMRFFGLRHQRTCACESRAAANMH
jgi:predicted esterase YcpF (UPF0227 family)